MSLDALQVWMDQNPTEAFIGAIGLSVVVFLIARTIIARGLTKFAAHTDTKYDDIIVKHLQPFRFAWIAPLAVLHIFAYLVPDYQLVIEQGALFLILWLTILTLSSLLDAANIIYESHPSYNGVAIEGYLDLIKILFVLVGLILSVSIFTGETPIVLLGSLGALTAILLLIFQDTILSLVASVQIAANDLVKEGDWIEAPEFAADGDVTNISLHTIKVQNFDQTISVIPTHKMMTTAYKNWRGMQESGSRRIKRGINIDLSTIKFVDRALLNKLKKVDLLKDYLDERTAEIAAYNKEHGFNTRQVINGRQMTNIGCFRKYIDLYLRTKEEIHQTDRTFLIYQQEPTATGVSLEIYVFAKTTDWIAYEHIQADIMDHLLAAAATFDLRVFQEPTSVISIGKPPQ